MPRQRICCIPRHGALCLSVPRYGIYGVPRCGANLGDCEVLGHTAARGILLPRYECPVLGRIGFLDSFKCPNILGMTRIEYEMMYGDL